MGRELEEINEAVAGNIIGKKIHIFIYCKDLLILIVIIISVLPFSPHLQNMINYSLI